MESPTPSLKIYVGTLPFSGDASCGIAEQTVEGKRFSTSYTCKAGVDNDAGLEALTGKLRDCLDVQNWTEQPGSSFGGARSAKYGLLRMSISRNGAAGLALGVEVFRDDQGRVMGSPARGDRTEADGRTRCTAKSLEAIESSLAGYGAKPGAKKFSQPEFIGFTNGVSSPVVAFMTRPIHPAHPALIVRDVENRGGETVLSAKGDFAGDCEEFHKLLGQIVQMNNEAAQRAK